VDDFRFGRSSAVYVPAAAAQQEPDWSKVQIKTTKVSGNIYMLEGQGGNIAASVGEDGIVIVDDQFAPLAEKIQAALKELKITDKPCVSSSTPTITETTPAGTSRSTTQAQRSSLKIMCASGSNPAAPRETAGSIKMDVKSATKAALPIITFEHDVTVHLNGEDIRALHFPSGHTDGDSIISSEKQCRAHGRRLRALRLPVH